MLLGWTGRVDPETKGDSRRWHQVIQPLGIHDAPGTAILGFACDEGVRRNGGRVGAAVGPSALRKMMSNLPVLDAAPLYDSGDVHCLDGDLEGAQSRFSSCVCRLLDAGHLVVGLGGGHEIAYASYLGLTQHLRQSRPRVAIVNLDAHFDLREQELASSGTSFLQALRHASTIGLPLDYICLGVSASANTKSLFSAAQAYGVHYYRDDQLSLIELSKRVEELLSWLADVDVIYLTVCLDVLPAATAPGVSAPSARGVSQEALELLLDAIVITGKVRLLDVAELSPPNDRNDETARVAARLIHRITSGIRKVGIGQDDSLST